MKKLMTLVTIFTISITVGWAQQGKVGMSWSATPASAAHSVFISPNTGKSYLDSVSAAWKKDSIVLQFSKLKYNAKGKLTSIKGSVYFISKVKNVSGKFSNNNLKKGIDIRIDNNNVSIEGE